MAHTHDRTISARLDKSGCRVLCRRPNCRGVLAGFLLRRKDLIGISPLSLVFSKEMRPRQRDGSGQPPPMLVRHAKGRNGENWRDTATCIPRGPLLPAPHRGFPTPNAYRPPTPMAPTQCGPHGHVRRSLAMSNAHNRDADGCPLLRPGLLIRRLQGHSACARRNGRIRFSPDARLPRGRAL